MLDSVNSFQEILGSVIENQSFVKVILSKNADQNYRNAIIESIQSNERVHYKLTQRTQTQDMVSILETGEQVLNFVAEKLNGCFKNANLFSTSEEVALMISKKEKVTILRKAVQKEVQSLTKHNRDKNYLIPLDAPFLKILGVSDSKSALIPKMAYKYRQINKYIEIVDGNVQKMDLPKECTVVDMGSGKGYLTFALYHYLVEKGFEPKVIGVELRQDLVDFCNEAAKKCSFKELYFLNKRIETFKTEKIDVLIALHACDTATDDAIVAGIESKAGLIILAPCCHKQVRQSLGKIEGNPILKYGIFEERQCEMLTDTIRAMYLEQVGYKTKVFEFVSNEHTRKNVMITAQLIGKKLENQSEIDSLKQEYNLTQHYIESKLNGRF